MNPTTYKIEKTTTKTTTKLKQTINPSQPLSQYREMPMLMTTQGGVIQNLNEELLGQIRTTGDIMKTMNLADEMLEE